MSTLARFHANNADALDPCWTHVGVAARNVLADVTERRKNPPENTDTVAEDRLAIREIEGGCADESAIPTRDGETL